MGFLIDTCILVDSDKLKQIDGEIYITDLSLFERLKNRSRIQQTEILETIKNDRKKYNLNLFTIKKRFLKVFYNDLTSNYKRIDEMCTSIAKHVIENYIVFISAIMMIIITAKNGIAFDGNGDMITSKKDQRDARFLNIISRSSQRFIDEAGHKLALAIYKQKYNFNKQKAEISIANIIINYYNKFIFNDAPKIENIESFNYEQLIKKNKVSCSVDLVSKCLDSFFDISNNRGITKSLYIAYILEILFYGGKMEFNDLIDMNILSSAIAKNMTFITSESKILRVVKNYEREFGLDGTISKSIKILN